MAGYDHDTGYDGMQVLMAKLCIFSVLWNSLLQDMDIETFTQDIDWAANALYDSHKYDSRKCMKTITFFFQYLHLL